MRVTPEEYQAIAESAQHYRYVLNVISYLLIPVGLLGIVLNILVAGRLYSALRHGLLTSEKRFRLRINLAVTDCLTGLGLAFSGALRFFLNESARDALAVLETFTTLSVLSPVINYVSLTMFQYLALRHPLLYLSTISGRTCKRLIAFQWISLGVCAGVFSAKLWVNFVGEQANKRLYYWCSMITVWLQLGILAVACTSAVLSYGAAMLTLLQQHTMAASSFCRDNGSVIASGTTGGTGLFSSNSIVAGVRRGRPGIHAKVSATIAQMAPPRSNQPPLTLSRRGRRRIASALSFGTAYLTIFMGLLLVIVSLKHHDYHLFTRCLTMEEDPANSDQNEHNDKNPSSSFPGSQNRTFHPGDPQNLPEIDFGGDENLNDQAPRNGSGTLSPSAPDSSSSSSTRANGGFVPILDACADVPRALVSIFGLKIVETYVIGFWFLRIVTDPIMLIRSRPVIFRKRGCLFSSTMSTHRRGGPMLNSTASFVGGSSYVTELRGVPLTYGSPKIPGQMVSRRGQVISTPDDDITAAPRRRNSLKRPTRTQTKTESKTNHRGWFKFRRGSQWPQNCYARKTGSPYTLRNNQDRPPSSVVLKRGEEVLRRSSVVLRREEESETIHVSTEAGLTSDLCGCSGYFSSSGSRRTTVSRVSVL